MTSVGDGVFPLHAEVDAGGALVAVQLSIVTDRFGRSRPARRDTLTACDQAEAVAGVPG